MDKTLFIYHPHMEYYLSGCFKYFMCFNLKLKQDDPKIIDNINNIFKCVKDNKLDTIFFLYNCSCIGRLLDHKLEHKLNTKVIAWHQKNYFSSKYVKHLHKIMEYSLEQCKLNSHYDHTNPNKYILFHYPAIMPPINELSKNIMDRYSGKYIFMGGNNNRNYKMAIRIARECPQYRFIFNLSNIACKKYIKDYINNIPDNVNIYLDVTPNEFLYAIQNAHVLLLPYRKEKSTVGHSTVAQGIYFKKPIISSIKSSMDESIIDGKTGYLVAIDDMIMTMNRVKTLMDDKVIYNEMVKHLDNIQHTRTKEYYLNRIKEVLMY